MRVKAHHTTLLVLTLRNPLGSQAQIVPIQHNLATLPAREKSVYVELTAAIALTVMEDIGALAA